MKVYPNDRGKKLVHALFVRYLRVSLAPNKQYIGEQPQYCLILEELELLVGAIYIFFYLLFEETIAFLSYLVLTAYFFSGLTAAFIKGFLGSVKGPYFPICFGVVFD